MRMWCLAGGLALILGSGTIPQAVAFPAIGTADRDDIARAWPVERVQSRIGYWRKRYDRAQYRRYRGNPGAQYQLRQKRRNLCRNTPEMC